MFGISSAKQVVKNGVSGRFANSQSASTVRADYEVLVIGAGIAGIGMACYLQQSKQPSYFGNKFFDRKRLAKSKSCKQRDKNQSLTQRFVVLEKRADLGGTWDLFNYPGIRSDSDALTFGYSFRPWVNIRMLASGGDIKSYITDTAREYKVIQHIRYRHEVQQLSWSSSQQLWTATIKNHNSGEMFTLSANFVVGATGYYDYEAGYRPQFEGEEDFSGQIVHPQLWRDVDYDDKKMVIIGSGATAMTLLPALVDKDGEQCARHVTMLQRRPTYVASVAGDDAALIWLSAKYSPLSEQHAYTLLRTRNVLRQQGVYQLAVHAPKVLRGLLKYWAKRDLKGSGVDVQHFLPDYNPWDERLCAIPDSDLYLALHGERAEVVTDEISHFTSTGITLTSGQHLDADIIVTATGLKLQMLGGAKIYVDGIETTIGTRMTYKAVLIEDIPNMAVIFGYTNASWTLKVDLACSYLIRLLSHMKKHDYQTVIPQAEASGEEAQAREDTIMGSLSAGYISRAQDELPKQGDRYPWRVTSNYLSDRIMLKRRAIKDKWLRFSR
ncbi:MAG: NAD(P)/FAD-dependent oxidoreductase [Psychrobacter sp.]|nr:NAD(P)/FAD-dependent oxidoreductase [Psychrobacter sp.]